LDPERPLDERIDDLLGRLTSDEKCALMLADSPAVERLGIPAYHWWNECLHGVARAGRATIFPQAIGMAAAFDPDLMRRIGEVIAEEGRAKYNAAVKAGLRGQYRGLTFWTPNINIFRDPRWGRGQETYGEDPYLSGELGASFVEGLQQEVGGYLKAAGCAKHYAVHSGPEGQRHSFNAVVSPKELRETYLPAFERLVKAGVESVMGAYNRTNDEPCCGSKLLLEDILRGEWQFTGHVVSDCGAIGDFHDYHKVTKNAEESAALAVSRGCDLNCGSVYKALPAALEQGLLTEEQIDASVRRLLRTRFRLGQFDPDERVPFSTIGTDRIRAPEHIQLAREAAEKSIVLLKNNGVLPILRDEKPRRIFLTGHNAASVDTLLGNYFGIGDSLVTVLEGLSAAAPEHYKIEYRMGMMPDRPNANPVDWGIPGKWDSFDAIIAVAGLVPMLEGEEGEAILSAERGDRTSIGLPEHQIERLRKLKATGFPLIVVLAGGSPIEIAEVQEIADAIFFMWYPGEQGGAALARLIFGDVSPSAKLPVTFPRSVEQLPPFEDYAMDGRTYRFMTEDPLYPFGFGLTYTSFAYTGARVEKDVVSAGETVRVSATLTNVGDTRSAEAVQCYISDLEGSVRTPIASLCGVQRVYVPSGSSVDVTFEIPPSAMELVQDDGSRRIEPGRFRLTIGSCAPGARGVELGAPEPAIVEFEVS
ncbi:MAG TPA: glycoside hydrolase family 3 N-terminal domain-containing protein, partial [Spirochaetia bacterium]|nr:glycoside hydrolase family 3 N-terminal domain-containing protein [Spirochaetia bacterium]